VDHDGQRRHFDEWAATYDTDIAGATGFPFEGYWRVLETIVEMARPRPGLRVLDVGTGTGNLAGRFAIRGCTVTGIDFSAPMLARAARAIPQASFLDVDLLGSWSALRDRTFDHVVAAYVFHEFDPATKLRLLARLAQQHLASEGSITIGDIAFRTPQDRKEAQQRWQRRWDPDEHYWTASETLAACRRLGLLGTFQQVSPCAGVFHFVQDNRAKQSGRTT